MCVLTAGPTTTPPKKSILKKTGRKRTTRHTPTHTHTHQPEAEATQEETNAQISET